VVERTGQFAVEAACAERHGHQARVVQHHVDAPVRVHGRVDELLQLVAVGHVGPEREGLSAASGQLLGERLDALDTPRAQRDDGAFLRKEPCRGLPKSAARARDDDAFSTLRVPRLARQLGMSISGFHHHFKAATGMSPLQFQKQLRLQEARRLPLAGDFDAATVGYRVGYDGPSHFSREYKRLFGEPPIRDVERLRSEGPSRRDEPVTSVSHIS
jgi:AraC-like DNA-binding protein